MFTACTDDSDYSNTNTAGGVTVDMQKPTFSTRENGNIFNVPIQVNGTANGSIIVYVETTPTANHEAAVADENYIVTSTRIIIPAGETVGNVEIRPLDNVEENDNRFFDVTITKVDGASIGNQPTTVVELRDNDSDPYEKMTGNWIMNCVTEFNGGDDGPFALTVQTPDPDDPEMADYYGHELYAYGLKGLDFIYMTFNFDYNEITEEVTMSIQTGGFATDAVINFGFKGIVIGCSVYEPGNTAGPDIPLTIEKDEKGNITGFAPTQPNAEYFLKVMEYPAMTYAGWWDGWTDMSFSRAQ